MAPKSKYALSCIDECKVERYKRGSIYSRKLYYIHLWKRQLNSTMAWFENVIDAIPVVGTGYRATKAVVAHASGDHDAAQREWVEAGTNLAGDALGLVTGGAGKVAGVAAKTGAKAAVKIAAKEGVKQAARAGVKAAAKAAGKQMTKRAMKRYAKKYIKKKVKKAAKNAYKEWKNQGDSDDDDYNDDDFRASAINYLVESGYSASYLTSLSNEQLADLLDDGDDD